MSKTPLPRRRFRFRSFAPFLALAAIHPNPLAIPHPPPHAELGRHDVSVIDTRRAIATDAVPNGVTLQAANNNLDVVRHSDGRVYLAFRTAPSHFASSETVLYVLSSSDEKNWQLETRFSVGSDLREPRLLSLGDSLMLYASVLGKSPFAFEPNGVRAAERSKDGTWSALKPLDLPGRVVWRARTVKGTPMLVAYSGGEHLYKFDGKPMSVELLTSQDGWHWRPLDPAHPAVYVGGGTEADFTLGDDGTLFGVIRNEGGDASGFGSEICRAPAGDLARWTCTADARKFDSPLMFSHDGEAYLVARRNVTEDGKYDRRLPFGTHAMKSLWNQAAYIWSGKRCALWRWVKDEQRVAYVTDLPSRGDTCFASAIPGERKDEWVVYDYSSNLDGPDLVWNAAQRSTTNIYRHVVRFTPR
ncbi:MAG: hypothetical protein ACXWUG_31865 [Polyangiales bacterium]